MEEIRDSSVAGLRAGWLGGSNSGRGWNFFLTPASRPVLGPIQLPIEWVPEAVSLGVKLSGREADHSPPSTAEVKNAWSYTSTPQYAFMAWCSVKAQGQLYLLPFTGWRWVVSFMTRQYDSRKETTCTYWIWGCVGRRAGMDAVVKKKNPFPAPVGNRTPVIQRLLTFVFHPF
jgi:hypothetical protein